MKFLRINMNVGTLYLASGNCSSVVSFDTRRRCWRGPKRNRRRLAKEAAAGGHHLGELIFFFMWSTAFFGQTDGQYSVMVISKLLISQIFGCKKSRDRWTTCTTQQDKHFDLHFSRENFFLMPNSNKNYNKNSSKHDYRCQVLGRSSSNTAAVKNLRPFRPVEFYN